MKKILSLILVLFAAFGVWYYLDNFSGDSEKLTLADANQPAFGLVYLAEELGYFDDEGLDVSYLTFSSGRDALAAAIDGDADLATVFETPIVIRSLEGDDIKIITELHSSSQNVGLIANKDAGVSNIASLRGKKVAVTENSGGEFIAHVILSEGGLEREDVQWVPAKPGEMVDLIASGEVDAIASWNPHLINAATALGGSKAISFFSEQTKEMSMIAGKSAFIEKNPEASKKLLRALVKADEYARANPDRFVSMIKAKFSDQSDLVIEKIMRSTDHATGLSNILITILFEEAEWFKLNQSDLAGEVDFRDIIFTDYLEEIDPSLVTIF